MTGLIAGTFCIIHEGHKYLIETALQYCDKLVVLLTSDSYPFNNKSHSIKSYEDRYKQLYDYLYEFKCDFIIIKVNSLLECIEIASYPEIEVKITTEEYRHLEEVINLNRKLLGIKPTKTIYIKLLNVSTTKLLKEEK